MQELREKIYSSKSIGYSLSYDARTGNPDEMTRSVEDLTDPFGPSISEKCAHSHIKAKFISLMPDAIARNYYISGEQGCAKRIPLDREKVEWEAEI